MLGRGHIPLFSIFEWYTMYMLIYFVKNVCFQKYSISVLLTNRLDRSICIKDGHDVIYLFYQLNSKQHNHLSMYSTSFVERYFFANCDGLIYHKFLHFQNHYFYDVCDFHWDDLLPILTIYCLQFRTFKIYSRQNSANPFRRKGPFARACILYIIRRHVWDNFVHVTNYQWHLWLCS